MNGVKRWRISYRMKHLTFRLIKKILFRFNFPSLCSFILILPRAFDISDLYTPKQDVKPYHDKKDMNKRDTHERLVSVEVSVDSVVNTS